MTGKTEIFHGKISATPENRQKNHRKMDDELKNEKFVSLSIKKSVAAKYKKYCKEISKTQSKTMLLMIEFFEHNQISPEESLGPQMKTLESTLKKRVNGIIAIIRDIEKNQTKPTTAMLQALMEQEEPNKKPLLIEKKRIIDAGVKAGEQNSQKQY